MTFAKLACKTQERKYRDFRNLLSTKVWICQRIIIWGSNDMLCSKEGLRKINIYVMHESLCKEIMYQVSWMPFHNHYISTLGILITILQYYICEGRYIANLYKITLNCNLNKINKKFHWKIEMLKHHVKLLLTTYSNPLCYF